jgi:alkanesulfonate monooxygenase SsuD/methylene tetrahydromethanopterin reductase-like flavin-dependent oxidoreductase (luciferase family)
LGQATLAAKQAAEIQILSGGRLRLGIGVGYNHLEYEALGVPFSEIGARLEEQVGVLRALWQAPLVEFDGAFHRLDRVGINPLPPRPVPIWMGATSPAGFRRVAALAEGWLCPGGDLRLRADEDVKREFVAWEDAGASHISLNTLAPPDRRREMLDVDGHIELLRHARAVIG